MALSTILKPAISYLVQQASQLALKGAMKGIELLRRIDNNTSVPSQPLTHKEVQNIQKQIHSATTGNRCVICGTCGGVLSKYLPKPVFTGEAQGKSMAKAIVSMGWRGEAILPITWKCAQCNEYVCFNCTLVIPDSNPIQFYEATYCSTKCKDAHNVCGTCKEPLVCQLDKLDLPPDNPLLLERADEFWSCTNPNCEKVGLTRGEA